MDSTNTAGEPRTRAVVMLTAAESDQLAALLVAVARPRTPDEQQLVSWWLGRLARR